MLSIPRPAAEDLPSTSYSGHCVVVARVIYYSVWEGFDNRPCANAEEQREQRRGHSEALALAKEKIDNRNRLKPAGHHDMEMKYARKLWPEVGRKAFAELHEFENNPSFSFPGRQPQNLQTEAAEQNTGQASEGRSGHQRPDNENVSGRQGRNPLSYNAKCLNLNHALYEERLKPAEYPPNEDK